MLTVGTIIYIVRITLRCMSDVFISLYCRQPHHARSCHVSHVWSAQLQRYNAAT